MAMDLKEPMQRLSGDDSAVSPVIGVILMVAITVILAAVIASFVLNFGSGLNEGGPTAKMSVSDAQGATAPVKEGGSVEDLLTIQHDGGDSLPSGEFEIRLRHEDQSSFTTLDTGDSEFTDITYPGGNDGIFVSLKNAPGAMSTGDDVIVTIAYSGDDTADEKYDYSGDKWDVQVIHTASETMVVDTTVNTA